MVLVTTLDHHVVSRQGGITQRLRARWSPLTFASDCTFDRRVSREARQDHRSRAFRRDHRPQYHLPQFLIMLPLEDYHHQPPPRRADSTRPIPGERQHQHQRWRPRCENVQSRQEATLRDRCEDSKVACTYANQILVNTRRLDNSCLTSTPLLKLNRVSE